MQSNHEGALVDAIHGARGRCARDRHQRRARSRTTRTRSPTRSRCSTGVKIEVHLSNPAARESVAARVGDRAGGRRHDHRPARRRATGSPIEAAAANRLAEQAGATVAPLTSPRSTSRRGCRACASGSRPRRSTRCSSPSSRTSATSRASPARPRCARRARPRAVRHRRPLHRAVAASSSRRPASRRPARPRVRSRSGSPRPPRARRSPRRSRPGRGSASRSTASPGPTSAGFVADVRRRSSSCPRVRSSRTCAG